MTLIAYDTVYPDEVASTTIRITVERNQHKPSFKPSSSYKKTVSDAFEVGEILVEFRAVDEDEFVRKDLKNVVKLCTMPNAPLS